MPANRGKKFEMKVREDWATTVPDSLCYRLIDATSGYHGIVNAGDLICYKYPDCFIIDCKSIQGNTFPVNFRQYDEMIKYQNITGLHCGVIIWFVDHDKVVWVPVETFMKLKVDGAKSFNIKMLGDTNYFALEITSTKLRTFMKSDYSCLINYYRR